MSISLHAFSVNGVFDKSGELVSEQTLTSIVLEIVTKLEVHSFRDFGTVRSEDITELDKPKFAGDNVTLLFRVGIVYCEIKALFDREKLLLKNTKFGVIR